MATSKQRRIALITGASSGIGRGFAERLAREGDDLVVVARREDVLREVAAGAEASGARAEVIAADLATEEGVAALEQRIAAGDIDLLVNNAGFGTTGEFAHLPLDREMEEIDLNVRALARLCHAALRPMYERGAGAIINVASTGGFQPVPYMATYSATKAFVLHFSEALHEESLRHGVTVTCLCPGPVRTGFQDAASLDTSKMMGVAWTNVDEVVDDALRAVRRRRAIAIPGALNRATAQTAVWMPRFVTRKIAGTMFRRAGKDGGG